LRRWKNNDRFIGNGPKNIFGEVFFTISMAKVILMMYPVMQNCWATGASK
jgi:hypothetical protein